MRYRQEQRDRTKGGVVIAPQMTYSAFETWHSTAIQPDDVTRAIFKPVFILSTRYRLRVVVFVARPTFSLKSLRKKKRCQAAENPVTHICAEQVEVEVD